MLNCKEMLSVPPLDLCDLMIEECHNVPMPEHILTPEDMNNAAEAMMVLTSKYSYLVSMLSYAKVMTRELKRCGEKKVYEDMIDRKEIVQNAVDCIKQQYSTISRAVTIHTENNAELRMNNKGYIE